MSIALYTVLLGCSTERPTRPEEVAKLPATPLSSPLVVDFYSIGALRVDSTYIFDFGDSELFRAATYDDISISFRTCATIETGLLNIYDHASAEWEEFKGAFPVVQSGRLDCDASLHRLVSQVESGLPLQFLDATGRMFLRSSFTGRIDARLVRYSDDYHFATVRNELVYGPISMSYSDNSLYAVMSGRNNDSLIAFDLEGNRRWSVAWDNHSNSPSAFDGTHVWTHAGGRLIQMDTLGNVVASLVSGLGRLYGMTWADGRLWCLDSGFSVIDVDSSLARDTVVAHYRFPIGPESFVFSVTADSIGPIFFSGIPELRIYRYTFQGELRDSFPCRHLLWAIASDGESLWALHAGPPEARSNAKLLTRFTLE